MIDQHTDDILKDALAQEVIRHLGLVDMSDDEKAQLIAQLGDVISDAVMEKVLAAVPESQRGVLVGMLRSGDTHGVQALLETHAGDMQQLVAEAAREEIEAFKQEMAADE